MGAVAQREAAACAQRGAPAEGELVLANVVSGSASLRMTAADSVVEALDGRDARIGRQTTRRRHRRGSGSSPRSRGVVGLHARGTTRGLTPAPGRRTRTPAFRLPDIPRGDRSRERSPRRTCGRPGGTRGTARGRRRPASGTSPWPCSWSVSGSCSSWPPPLATDDLSRPEPPGERQERRAARGDSGRSAWDARGWGFHRIASRGRERDGCRHHRVGAGARSGSGLARADRKRTRCDRRSAAVRPRRQLPRGPWLVVAEDEGDGVVAGPKRASANHSRRTTSAARRSRSVMPGTMG